MGTLFVVATPIGNLADITFRAIETLKQVSRIAAEDTRQTRKLLDHYGISTPLVSCHEHNEQARATEFVEQLRGGASLAVVTDAGTPLISDPGFRLVRAAIDAGLPVVPIPGPSAAVAAISASGLPVDQFLFAGFLPQKSGQRRRRIEEIAAESRTVVYYEAPHRILEALADIESALGPDRPVVVARELTKLHEEFLRGPVAQVRATLAARPSIKGEITLLVGPAKPSATTTVVPDQIRDEIRALVKAGTPRMDAIKAVAQRHGLPKREVYKMVGGSSARLGGAN